MFNYIKFDRKPYETILKANKKGIVTHVLTKENGDGCKRSWGWGGGGGVPQ